MYVFIHNLNCILVREIKMQRPWYFESSVFVPRVLGVYVFRFFRRLTALKTDFCFSLHRRIYKIVENIFLFTF